MFIALYVDDLIFTVNNVELIEAFKEVMKKEFEMIDLGLMKYFLDLEVIQERTISLCRRKCMMRRSLRSLR